MEKSVLKTILDYKLYDTDKITITVYTILLVFIILGFTRLLIGLLHRVFNRYFNKNKIDTGQGNTIFQIIRYFLWIISISVILETSGVKITFLLAGSAALLVGLGLGLQQIFQDILSGIVILFEGTLKLGDIVQLENGIVGKVKQMGLRVSYIETRDNIIMIIPNSKFVNGNVINWSHMEKITRFNVEVGVAYGSDVRLVEEILLQCTNDQKEISKTPAPFVMFANFGESSLDFKLFFWTYEAFWVERIKSELRFKINDAFRAKNIQIPFPQRDVHLKNN